MQIQPLTPIASVFDKGPSSTPVRAGSLLSAGDHVVVGSDDRSVHEIIYISRQKAWVRALRGGSQSIVILRDLQLVKAGSMLGVPLS